MAALIRDVSGAGWRQLYALGPWQVFLAKAPNKYGCARLTVRLLDARAPRRAWWFAYHAAEGRMSCTVDSEDLAQSHPDFFRDLQMKLRGWRPQP